MVNWRRIRSKKPDLTMKCHYGAGSYSMTFRTKDSPYLGMKPTVRSYDFLPYYSTIDDPAVKDASKELAEQLEERNERIKASVLLSMIQQNIKYTSDESLYGEPDVWGIPISTVCFGKGDCDCMTNLYVSMAHSIGLDVVTVLIEGHMFPAVCFEGGHGRSYKHEGKTYYHMEVTDELPAAGRFWQHPGEIHAISAPLKPSVSFRNTLRQI